MYEIQVREHVHHSSLTHAHTIVCGIHGLYALCEQFIRFFTFFHSLRALVLAGSKRHTNTHSLITHLNPTTKRNHEVRYRCFGFSGHPGHSSWIDRQA
jgi:hypothetical protein